MSNLNGLFLATVVQFFGSNEDPATPDDNGKMPVLLNVVSGRCPNKRVLSGTVAERGNMEVGKSYIFSCTEGAKDPKYGRQFSFSAVQPVAGIKDILDANTALGAPQIVDVTSSVAETANNFEA